MYDFYFGTPAEIEADEEGFLLGVKRLLPRWVNSIPDSEYLALHQLFEKHCRKQRPVLVETGVGASNVLANVVRAGVIDTPLHTKFPKDLEQRRQLIPLQRLGQPEDVAGMVNYLVSDSGNYITGQLFSVAGGE